MSWDCKFASWVCTLLVMVSAAATSAYTQNAEQVLQVRKLYVDSLGTDRGAADMREQMVRLLRKSHDVQVVSDPKEADALVKGTGRIWVTDIFL